MNKLAEQLMACVELGKAVTSTLDRESILEIILSRLSQLIRAHNWTLYLIDREKSDLRFEVVVGLEPEKVKGLTIKLGEGIAGMVAQTGEAIMVPDANHDRRFSHRIDDQTGFLTHSLITLPLKKGDTVLGVLQIVNPEDQALFSDEYLPILHILADFVAIAINNAINHERIETLVVTDDVSGFYNSRFLNRKLRDLISSGTATALVFLDMDNFKRIVDAYGHPLGSKVLREVAAVMGSHLADGQYLVRFGGDEYVIILPGCDKGEALQLVEDIRDTMAQTAFLAEDGHDVRVTASFGIARFPDDANDLKGLLQSADLSMYKSKDSGKDSVTVS